MVEDPDALARKVARADRVRRFLEEEGVNESLASLRQQFIDRMIATKPGEDNARYRLWQAVHILDMLKAQLAGALDDGKLAERELKRIEGGKRPFF